MKYIKVIFSLLMISALICIPFQKALVIEGGKTNELLAYLPLYRSVDNFHIRYTHSIHLSDVEETYTVLEDGTIRQIELTYEDTAIGMPSNAEKGETFKIEDGQYRLLNMKRDFPFIYMKTAQVVGTHRIIYNDHELDLAKVISPGSLILLKEKRLALWELWRGVNIVGRST
ncbi:DUF1850 domain-containing protein [Bacillus sp. SD088]|uniref:DUF1850 domain-containing protein n=1 Tax=Bacillus sp. SD088 TaxID=2782012 RepID=UPI001A97B17E|nr:DUF1850 domain-containing protein [Bacillus sp. SD088]MBO0994541.1 DUF1850 domain-containing protein [Bacillus sp. SD088]